MFSASPSGDRSHTLWAAAGRRKGAWISVTLAWDGFHKEPAAHPCEICSSKGTSAGRPVSLGWSESCSSHGPTGITKFSRFS